MDRHDYQALPDDMVKALHRYQQRKDRVGDFLRSLLENNLHLAVTHADDVNLPLIPVYMTYIYNRLPMECWGSPACVRAWLGEEGMTRHESDLIAGFLKKEQEGHTQHEHRQLIDHLIYKAEQASLL